MGLFANWGGPGASRGIMNAASIFNGNDGEGVAPMQRAHPQQGYPQQGYAQQPMGQVDPQVDPQSDLRAMLARLMGHQQQLPDNSGALGNDGSDGGPMGGMFGSFNRPRGVFGGSHGGMMNRFGGM